MSEITQKEINEFISRVAEKHEVSEKKASKIVDATLMFMLGKKIENVAELSEENRNE